MSSGKRASLGQSNTLFNYFSSPKTNVKKEEIDNNGPTQHDEDLHDVEPIVASSCSKRRHRILSSSESEDDDPSRTCKRAKPEFEKNETEKSMILENLKHKRRTVSNLSEEQGKSDVSCDSLQSRTSLCEKNDLVNKMTKSNGRMAAEPSEEENSENQAKLLKPKEDWIHLKLDFLKPDKLRDAKKNKPNDPDYDPHTLYVPEEFLNKQTPAMRQWWVLKSQHYDCVLFFKVGKFYELYHMDAVVGVQALGFSYMKGEFAHSGFPEMAYAKMSSSLLEQGFKVVRVEQTETPEMMAERCKATKKCTKFDKVVKREACQVTTSATIIHTAQLPEATREDPCYMLAISEREPRFGVCFVDTSIGVFHIGEFDDDNQYSRLSTLIAEYPPGLILTERGKLRKATADLLADVAGKVRRDALLPKKQFYDAQKTLDLLDDYVQESNRSPVFKTLTNDVHSPNEAFVLALKSLGACIWYLKNSLIDTQVLSLNRFELYQPSDLVQDEEKSGYRKHMIIDSVTMKHLNLLGQEGTLQRALDFCQTAFGRRLLQEWICRPLYNVQKIQNRQDAVQYLLNNQDVLTKTRHILKRLPDLEREIAKCNIFGNKDYASSHPDSRAIFYDEKTYSNRKLMTLIRVLDGFSAVQEIPEHFSNCDAKLLQKITNWAPKGIFPDLQDRIRHIVDNYDLKMARETQKIIPLRGVNADYDEVENRISAIEEELEVYRKEQCKYFGCEVKYFGSDKKRFQLEVPEKKCHKAGSNHKLEGSKKGSKRYSTDLTREFLRRMMQAEAEKSAVLRDLNRQAFAVFNEGKQEWLESIQCLMLLDVICSLAEFSRCFSREVCLPTVVSCSQQPYLTVTEGCHPCIRDIMSYVSNDLALGTSENQLLMVLTGPNMGGKSTIMRQTAIIIIMAQMGCFVPAASCEVSLVDRIFTRIGAYDDLIHGQSTFFVELTEAQTILKHATKHSFALLDELGRGTSTHDGEAIAAAYLKKLLSIQCRTIFSTHYHDIIRSFSGVHCIQLTHMSCMVDKDDAGKETVTFLYKMWEGHCPKSYGFNVAKLAGLPAEVVQLGEKVSQDLDQKDKRTRLFRNIFACGLPTRELFKEWKHQAMILIK